VVDVHYYPNEGHGFEKRENQIDAIKRTIARFDQYLIGKARQMTQRHKTDGECAELLKLEFFLGHLFESDPVNQTRQIKVGLCVLLVFRIFSGAYAHAQEAPGSTPLLHRNANIVLVPTLVKTSSGEPIFGLNVNDFILTEDGIEQRISLEENFDSQPLALVIVVRTGGAGRRRLDTYRELGPLLDSLVGAVPHRVAVVGFEGTEAEAHADRRSRAAGAQ